MGFCQACNWLYFLGPRQVSCSPGRAPTQCVAKDDFQPLTHRFSSPEPPDLSPRAEDPEARLEQLYQQSRAYVTMNERLRQAGDTLRQKFEDLRQADKRLEQDVSQVTSATS